MYELFYRTEVNVICLLILAWIVYQSKTNQDQQTKNVVFRRVMISSIAVLVLETAQFHVDGHAGLPLFVVNNVLVLLYLSMNAVMAFFWFVYIFHFVVRKEKIRDMVSRIMFIPVVVFIMLLVLSVFTRSIFYVERETNRFMTGSCYFVQAILTYGFFTTAAVVAFVSLFLKTRQFSRTVTLVAFIIVPLLGGVFHLIFPEAKIVWQALSLSQMLVFCDYRFSLVSLDALTGMNNRRSFDARMSQLAAESSGQPYLFMMDINLFKNINDGYGHPEGDEALVSTAAILKDVFSRTDAYLSRYGGDEFAAVFSCDDADAVRQMIYRAFTEYNNTSGKPYQLTMSVGYARQEGSGKESVADLVRRADQSLYEEKRRAHGEQV